MMYIYKLIGMLFIGFQVNATSSDRQTTDDSNSQKSEYQIWKESRLERLMQPNGWLSLVGLEWLVVGDNTIGSAADNDIELSHGPAYIGTLTQFKNKSMTFTVNPGVDIKADDQLIKGSVQVRADSSEAGATIFNIDTFEFFVVERDKMAFRIKDSKAKTRTGFLGLEYFPEDSKYRIDAKFIPYDPVKIIPTANVLGILSDSESPGRLEFNIEGKDYSLDALESSESYYMIFGDKTNGRSTYGPGRGLYTDGKVNDAGMVRIDFNKSYNPPCSFTAFSTCTLPPLQNRMPVMIEAGEKKYANSVY